MISSSAYDIRIMKLKVKKLCGKIYYLYNKIYLLGAGAATISKLSVLLQDLSETILILQNLDLVEYITLWLRNITKEIKSR